MDPFGPHTHTYDPLTATVYYDQQHKRMVREYQKSAVDEAEVERRRAIAKAETEAQKKRESDALEGQLAMMKRRAEFMLAEREREKKAEEERRQRELDEQWPFGNWGVVTGYSHVEEMHKEIGCA